jgi:hypothetical protein
MTSRPEPVIESRLMNREIFVVARDRPDLFRYLSETFAEADNVDVILDRRTGEDDTGWAHERRARPKVEEDLRSVGYAFITLQ